jgi:hypothetical protein
MARPSKPWKLSEEESFSSFTSWKTNIEYTLGRDKDFSPFLADGTSWQKVSAGHATRGLAADEAENGLSAAQKAVNLEHMLGLIATWVPHYLSNEITKNSTDIESIWQAIRKYYGFKQSESQFMRYSSIALEEGERPERLYHRLMAHITDNLLTKDSALQHGGEKVVKNEDFSPSLERLVVLRWMELIHPGLPTLVQRTFAYDLQRMTLKDLQPQICDAIPGFLEELKNDENVRASRAHVQHYGGRPTRGPSNRSFGSAPSSSRSYNARKAGPPIHTSQSGGPKIECRVCKAEGRRYLGHSLQDCDYLSNAEKRGLPTSKSFLVATDHPEEEDITHGIDECGLDDQQETS